MDDIKLSLKIFEKIKQENILFDFQKEIIEKITKSLQESINRTSI